MKREDEMDESSADMRGLLAPKNRKGYVFGGKAVITILNPKSQNRFTFRVVRSKDKGDGRPPVYWVRVLTGPDNQSNYKNIGMVRDEADFFTTAYSEFRLDAPCVKAFVWFLKNMESELIEVWHEGICGVCGRKLTVPESIEKGIGPVCESRGAA